MSLGAELLESRDLLTGGVGSLFAVIPATVPNAGSTVDIPFTLAADQFHAPRGHFTLGIDVSAVSGSPMIVSVDNAQLRTLHRATHAQYDPIVSAKLAGRTQTSAAVVDVALSQHLTHDAVRITEDPGSSGFLRLGFYLPGDINGDGTVTRADIQAIQSSMGARYGDPRYSIDADSNRDGLISKNDVTIARRNLGVRTTVTPVFTLSPDPAAGINSHTGLTTVQNLTFVGTATPGATIVLDQQQAAVPPVGGSADASGNVRIVAHLSAGINTFKATMTDEFGQKTTLMTLPVRYQPPAQ
jgi:hypothetical protein